MPIYRCENPTCESFDQEIYRVDTRIELVNGRITDVNQICPKCGEKRVTVKKDGFTTTMKSSSGNIPR